MLVYLMVNVNYRSFSPPSVPDIDECTDVPGVCGTAQCRNLIGSYECLCDVGYVYNNETKTCEGASDFCWRIHAFCVKIHLKTLHPYQRKSIDDVNEVSTDPGSY